jgi:hypothetical protein
MNFAWSFALALITQQPERKLAYDDFRLALPAGNWQANEDVAKGATAMMMHELGGEGGGGIGLMDQKSQAFIHAAWGIGKPMKTDARAAAEHFVSDVGDYFGAGWKVSKRERSDTDELAVARLEGRDENGLTMIAHVVAGVDRAGRVHGAGVQCVFPRQEVEKTCRTILSTFRLAATDLQKLGAKKK